MSSRRRELRAAKFARLRGKSGEINVVSLIDIFAILVFYLLVNALVVQVIPEYENLQLPASMSTDAAQQAVIVAVSSSEVLVDDHPVMTVVDAMSGEPGLLIPLKSALQELVVSEAESSPGKEWKREVNIVGDRSTPYHLLKKILATCTAVGFERISMAVQERS